MINLDSILTRLVENKTVQRLVTKLTSAVDKQIRRENIRKWIRDNCKSTLRVMQHENDKYDDVKLIAREHLPGFRILKIVDEGEDCLSLNHGYIIRKVFRIS